MSEQLSPIDQERERCLGAVHQWLDSIPAASAMIREQLKREAEKAIRSGHGAGNKGVGMSNENRTSDLNGEWVMRPDNPGPDYGITPEVKVMLRERERCARIARDIAKESEAENLPSDGCRIASVIETGAEPGSREAGMSVAVPLGYLEFELNPSTERYEDDAMLCIRHQDGSVTMTLKPWRDPFIYAEPEAEAK